MLDRSMRDKYYWIIIFGLCCVCLLSAERPVGVPDWQTVHYCNSTTAYGRVTINGGNATEEDLIAAFVGEECRGKQHVNLLEEESYVTLVINGEIPELVSFYLYEVSTNLIYPLGEELTNPGGSIGYPPDILELSANTNNSNHLPVVNLPDQIVIEEGMQLSWDFGVDIYDEDADLLYVSFEYPPEVAIYFEQPNWAPVVYSGATQIFGEVYIEGEAAPEGALVAAFSGEECRGVGQISYWGDIPFLSISVYGIEIQPVSFLIYQGEEGGIWHTETVVFTNPGGMVGYPDLVDINGDREVILDDIQFEVLEMLDEDAVLSVFVTDDAPVSRVRADILLSTGIENIAPKLNLPLVSIFEDEGYELELAQYVIDPDSEQFTFQVFNDSEIETQLCGSVLSIEPEENWFGEAQMEILVSDGMRSYDIDTLHIEVMAVNDAPELSLPEEISFDEDEYLYLDFCDYIRDVEGDSISLYFTGLETIMLEPSEVYWEPEVYLEWCSAYMTVSYEGSSLSSSSRIAAFAGTECRGVTQVILYEGISYAIIRIYCEETTGIRFKVYDDERDVVYGMLEEIEISPGSNLGFPPNYYPLALDFENESIVYRVSAPANWNGSEILEILAFDSWQDISTGSMQINCLPVNDAPEMNCSEISFATGNSDWIDMDEMILEPDGESVNVEILENAELNLTISGNILSISPAPDIESDHTVSFNLVDESGLSTLEEVTVSIKPAYELSKNLSAGWNWLGFGIGSNHYGANDILSTIGGVGNYLKGLTGYLCYYDNFGWVGTLEELLPVDLYKLSLEDNAELIVSGWELEVSETPIIIHSGWNWVSYLPSQALPLCQALEELNGNALYVKYISGYAIYNPQYGWVGPLTEMSPGKGYAIYAQNEQIFHYPQVDSTEREVVATNYHSQSLEPENYQYTASLTAVIPGYIPQENDLIKVYSEGELVGTAGLEERSVIQVGADTGEYYWFIYLYTNKAYPENLSLELIEDGCKPIKFINSISWQPDSRIGSLEEPVILQRTELKALQPEDKITIYPNPFIISGERNTLHINLLEREDGGEVGIYNLKGQFVSKLVIAESQGRSILLSPDNWNLPDGVYLLEYNQSSGKSYYSKLLLFH